MITATSHPLRVPADARSLPAELKNRHYHLLGIGGSGMSGLAALLLKHHAVVSGSDAQSSLAIVRLMESGADITTRESADTLPPGAEFVVASAAIPPDHPALCEAARRGLPVFKYAQMLGELMARHHGLAVCGTHGKSTTTAWTAFVLKRAGLDPSFVVGAAVPQLGGGSGVGDGPHFVAEACEYDRSFLNLRPHAAAVLNVEEDHLDYYRDLDDILDAFSALVRQVPADGRLVLNGDDGNCRRLTGAAAAPVETFGISAGCTWRASRITTTTEGQSFDLHHLGQLLGRVEIQLAGAHNVSNALAVAALASHCGLPWDAIGPGLGAFRGVQRRLELRGHSRGVLIVDDYGHHPTEVRATLAAARQRFAPGRLWCVFQPHQHSRTRFLMDDFARSFAAADRVVVPDIYFVRDTQRDRDAVSARDLVERIRQSGGDAVYIPHMDEIVEFLLSEARAGDLVLTMGAGTIWKVADELVRRLGGDLHN